jgi:hypothetical protein
MDQCIGLKEQLDKPVLAVEAQYKFRRQKTRLDALLYRRCSIVAVDAWKCLLDYVARNFAKTLDADLPSCCGYPFWMLLVCYHRSAVILLFLSV